MDDPKLLLTRRSLLLGAAALGACAPRAAAPAPARSKRILVLGGTQFLGPEIVRIARARGHTLTLFNRGKTNPQLFPDVEKLHGDRKTGELAALDGRTWDAVIDTSGYVPRTVTESATRLRSTRQYVFVSSISVYDTPSPSGVDESAKVGVLEDPATEKVDEKTYGPLKAACERAAEAALPGRVTVIRPGLIVGPDDPSDRFTYWPARLDGGGEVLAPGDPQDPVQFIDARDLASFTVLSIERETFGTYNAVGPGQPMGVVLSEIARAIRSPASLTWVDADFLAAQKVAPWSDMPVWVPSKGEEAGLARIDTRKAMAKGLVCRPVSSTARDTLAWWRSLPEERRAKPRAGLSRDRERDVLAAFHARG